MQYFENEGRLVGVFDFRILKFEEGGCPRERGFSNAGVHPSGGLKILSKNRGQMRIDDWHFRSYGTKKTYKLTNTQAHTHTQI